MPRSLTSPTDPVGAPFIKAGIIRFRGNTKRGGIYDPAALKAQRAVTFGPLSALVAFLTCLTPLVQTTFPGYVTVVKPVSSQFQILVGANVFSFRRSLYKTKNDLTASTLKP